MANIKFPRKEIEKHIKITKEVEEKISLMGTPLESSTPKEIEIEVFPNRPDLLNLEGFIRALKLFLGKEKKIKKYEINKPKKNYLVSINKNVKKIRPYTVCAIIKKIKFTEEKIKDIINFQEKIHSTLGRNRKKLAIGIYPLDKIRLPIKYEAKNPKEIKFIPLESSKEMDAHQILKKHPMGKKYSHLLKDYEKCPVFIDANKKILSMPPIINSSETGKITEKTRDVFVECSGFDKELLNKTLTMVVSSLAECGGEVYSMKIKDKKSETTPDFSYRKINISLKEINKLLGLNLKNSELKKLLLKMGHDYKENSVFVPPWRTDILHEVDIAEDIAIAYGYDKIIPEMPEISTIGKQSSQSKLKSKISEILTGLKLLETSSYHLAKKDEVKKTKTKEVIELEKSKTDYKFLRPDLLTPILRTLSENKNAEYPQRLFEIGTVFKLNKDTETGIEENTNLIIVLSPGNFTEAKQHLDYLMNSLEMNYILKESSIQDFIDGRTGEIFLENKKMGHIGEIHPQTLKKWNLKMSLSVVEISLEKIHKILYPK